MPTQGPARRGRLALIAFGVVFVVLFVVVAIAEGLGDPSIPSGDVVLVEGAPGETGEVSKAEFEHAFAQTAAQAQLPKVPKPGEGQYDELKEATLENLFEYIWLEGLAEEMGISVSAKEVAAELKKLKSESFPKKGDYRKFLKEAGLTQEDVDRQVGLQVLSTKIQDRLKEDAPKPSSDEIDNYYEAAKATQFTQQPNRSVRQVRNNDRKKARKAREELAKGHTAKDWERVAKKYSEDAATKDKGGLQEGVSEEFLGAPLGEAVFDAPEGQVEGPLESGGSFYVFEVTGSTPEGSQPLAEVRSSIQSQLAQRLEQEYFNSFVTEFNEKWRARTFCAEGYEVKRCANFKLDGHPPAAPPGCYEENPEGGPPDACPAPVFQLIPALPGSITPLEPKGKPLPQRPQPVEGADTGSAGEGELPAGAVPPAAE